VSIWLDKVYEGVALPWTPPKAMPVGTLVWWQVRALNTGGVGPWSAWASFTLRLAVTDFVGTPLTGDKPLAVKFTDKSEGQVTAWAWQFGDGGTSTAQHPTHTYTAYGVYTVSLTVTRSGGTGTATKAGYIKVAALPPVLPPVPIAPVGNVLGGANPPPFSWTAVANATAYDVDVWQDRVYEGVTSPWTPPRTFTVGTLYWWRVRARNTGGVGPWSAWASFTLRLAEKLEASLRAARTLRLPARQTLLADLRRLAALAGGGRKPAVGGC
jgi:PKD repeat protein